MTVQAELVRNSSRYPGVLWETFVKEMEKKGVEFGTLSTHLENVALAYKRVCTISERMFDGELSRTERGIAKAFWLMNVSWAQAFFQDITAWGNRHALYHATLGILDSDSFRNFYGAHYNIPKRLNGGKELKVPFQQPSLTLHPILDDLEEDLKWSKLMRKTVLRFAPLAIFDSVLRRGDSSYRNHVMPLMESYVGGKMTIGASVIALSFAKADLVFFEGLFEPFVKAKLFSDEVSDLVTRYLKAYKEELQVLSP